MPRIFGSTVCPLGWPRQFDAFRDFMGAKPIADQTDSIAFRREDMKTPFISHNRPMLDYLEPEMESRLSGISAQGGFSRDMYKAVMEILPSGRCTIDDAASEMGVGKRTVQRRLSEEGTSFSAVLASVRRNLAEYYIGKMGMDTGETAFILGYRETNSFLRAFRQWTGMTVTEFRNRPKVRSKDLFIRRCVALFREDRELHSSPPKDNLGRDFCILTVSTLTVTIEQMRSNMYLLLAYLLGSFTIPVSLSSVTWYISAISPNAERPLTTYSNASSGMFPIVMRSL